MSESKRRLFILITTIALVASIIAVLYLSNADGNFATFAVCLAIALALAGFAILAFKLVSYEHAWCVTLGAAIMQCAGQWLLLSLIDAHHTPLAGFTYLAPFFLALIIGLVLLYDDGDLNQDFESTIFR